MKNEPKAPLDLTILNKPVFTPTAPVERTEHINTAAEFEAKRRDADEALCEDCLIYLRAGLNPVAVVEVVKLRRGSDFGVSEQKIEQAVLLAVELENKRRKE